MILDQLKKKQIQALKEKDMERLSVVRYLVSEIHNKEIALRSQNIELTDKHVIKTIEKQIKQRKESIEEYKKGERQDLVNKESKELEILEELQRAFSE